MFETIFKNALSTQNNGPLINELWAEIVTSYSTPGRYYHTLNHLDHISNGLTAVKNEIQNWQTIIAAVAYHDIVYNPLHHDNEEKSASLAFDRLTQLGWPAAPIEECYGHIIATKHHQYADKTDTNYFTDADLSILGAEADHYLEYSTQVRKEYQVYPDDIYIPGRKKVLIHFISMESIFKTRYFRLRYEDQARKNISMELAMY
jgi:predicted metal-dependent HD superfamily phosphohydrolase